MDNDLLDQSADRGFLHFWGKSMEGGTVEGGNIGEFRGAVRVVSVPARAITCVDPSLFFHIRQTS